MRSGDRSSGWRFSLTVALLALAGCIESARLTYVNTQTGCCEIEPAAAVRGARCRPRPDATCKGGVTPQLYSYQDEQVMNDAYLACGNAGLAKENFLIVDLSCDTPIPR